MHASRGRPRSLADLEASTAPNPLPSADPPASGGELARLIREKDWSRTPLGPAESWSPALRMMVRFLLANRFPLLLWWGPQYVSIYNDAYVPVLGAKHPWALGQPVSTCWSEIWHVLQPLIDTPFHGGPATWNDDIALEINRYGFLEETHFTVAYSPVPDETVASGIGGVLATVHEISDKVVSERRVVALRDLGARIGDARTAEEACALAAETLSGHSKDVPFALLYLIDNDTHRAHLAGAAGVPIGDAVSPATVDLSAGSPGRWPLGGALRSGTIQIVSQLGERFANIPPGPWSDPPNTAVVVPIPSTKAHQPAGVMVAGVSARLKFDDYYRDFLVLVRNQVATAIANARAYEEERRRAEELAELDRAKTVFFSNVSHEFRTPLTLMLGPAEDLLRDAHGPLTGAQRLQLDIVRRNANRMLKLVNALLDFSRLEAGRTQASYSATDVAGLTRDLAGTFRSAIERAGLRLDVHCETLDEPVYVDRDMWEKIVLNLLSNAFKFTLEGSVGVDLRRRGHHVELTVQDTGAGIPEADLPRVFERFHRVEGARSRTHEGSGIGLALTNELVRLHGGEVTVASRLGEGSVFTVRIPTGRAHLPQDRIDADRDLVSTATGAEPFVDEASRWLSSSVRVPNGSAAAPERVAAAPAGGPRERILVADDNADMRDYLRHLLQEWQVETATDGLAALQKATSSPPDLIVTDVMMPGLDGFGLLEALKKEPRTQAIPVVMLSARAGEEARVSGLGAGADDYVTKPFSARELAARVRSLLALSKARRETDQLRRVAEAASRTKDEFLAMLGHELRNPLAPIFTALQLMNLRGDDGTERERTVIDRQVRHLVRLVDDLLDVSRIARGKIELRRQNVELAEIVASAVETTSPLMEERQHRLELNVPRTGLVVNGDVTRLTQIVVNILSNAAKYTEPRGDIRVAARRIDEQLELRFRDTGIGISADMLPRVFNLFTQERQALDRAHGGLGLGLTIVRTLVELHGGTIEAHSEGLGQGSEFVVRLPAVNEEARRTTQGAAEAPPTVARTGRRILVVDDNADAARLAAETLERLGHDTSVAFDGPSAIIAADAARPDVALLDLGLPLMDGYELAQRLAGDAPGQGPLLVAVTGYGQSSDYARTRAAGFHAHVVKPVDFVALAELLDRLLTERA